MVAQLAGKRIKTTTRTRVNIDIFHYVGASPWKRPPSWLRQAEVTKLIRAKKGRIYGCIVRSLYNISREETRQSPLLSVKRSNSDVTATLSGQGV